MSDLAAALQIAIRVHAGQTDKQGEPYLLHVLRVVEAVSDEAKVVAALHDVLEDADLHRWDSIQEEAGIAEYELGAVELLTRLEGVTYAQYIDNILNGPGYPARVPRLAREVKLADLRDNLGRIPPGPYDEKGKLKHDGDPEAYMGALEPNWASLEARYEKAIAILSASPREQT